MVSERVHHRKLQRTHVGTLSCPHNKEPCDLQALRPLQQSSRPYSAARRRSSVHHRPQSHGWVSERAAPPEAWAGDDGEPEGPLRRRTRQSIHGTDALHPMARQPSGLPPVVHRLRSEARSTSSAAGEDAARRGEAWLVASDAQVRNPQSTRSGTCRLRLPWLACWSQWYAILQCTVWCLQCKCLCM